jgi:hypothetical protein
MIRKGTSIAIGLLLVEIMISQLALTTRAVLISPVTLHLANMNEVALSTDGISPTIENVSFSPSNPTVVDDVCVNTTVSDDLSGVNYSRVSLYYRCDDGQWNMINMQGVITGYPEGTEYVGHIPKQASGTKVEFYIEAYDNAGNRGINDKDGEYYSYIVQDSTVNPSTDTWNWGPFITILGLIACLAMFIIYVKKARVRKTTT